jgi:cell division protein FtsB
MPTPKTDPPGPSRDKAVEQKLEALKKEYAKLHTQKITTEANINNLEVNLAKLRAAAEKDYGTSDLAQLHDILESRRRDNEARVAKYEQHVKEIQKNLAAIETTHEDV